MNLKPLETEISQQSLDAVAHANNNVTLSFCGLNASSDLGRTTYQAKNIIEFWRRWNITLSRFLRDYLYIPLGGNRNGLTRRYINLMITMLLGGLWHGANWTFFLWGGLHGFYLCINHGWINFKKNYNISINNKYISLFISQLITFMAVVIAWVFFRSPDFTTAFNIFHAMFLSISINSSWYLPHALQFFSLQKILASFVLSLIIIFFLPNIYQSLFKFRNLFMIERKINPSKIWTWYPNLVWNSMASIIFVLGILYIQSFQ